MADTVVFPIEGRKIVGNWWRGLAARPTSRYSIHLFKDFEPPFDQTLTVARFTRSTFPGYEAVQRHYQDNGEPQNAGGGIIHMRISIPTPTFTCTFGSELVKGFWLQDNHTSKILFCALYEEPFSLIGPAQHTLDLDLVLCQCADV